MFTVLEGDGVLVRVVTSFRCTWQSAEKVWVKVCLTIGRDDGGFVSRGVKL